MAGRLNMILCMAMIVMASMIHVSLGQTIHVVGHELGWTIPPGGDVAYQTWAATRTFTVGDVLVFNFTTEIHDVYEVNRDAFNSCDSTSPISVSPNGPARITLTTAGEHYYMCNFPRHCSLGQRLAINVSAATTTTPAPRPAAPAPTRARVVHVVGDALGWTIPPGGINEYQTWANGQNFMVGDILVFNFTTGRHDVTEVSGGGLYNSCSTDLSPSIITTGPARIPLIAAGQHYYICTMPSHCLLGQRFAINVDDDGGASSTPTPTGFIPSPPNNSASTFSVRMLPFTFLIVALAFLYN